jgi:hypothetical protein
MKRSRSGCSGGSGGGSNYSGLQSYKQSKWLAQLVPLGLGFAGRRACVCVCVWDKWPGSQSVTWFVRMVCGLRAPGGSLR